MVDLDALIKHLAAEMTALRIMVSALTDLYPDPDELKDRVREVSGRLISQLPTETQEQRLHIEMALRKLNTFADLL